MYIKQVLPECDILNKKLQQETGHVFCCCFLKDYPKPRTSCVVNRVSHLSGHLRLKFETGD